jgi:hypothetical protein
VDRRVFASRRWGQPQNEQQPNSDSLLHDPSAAAPTVSMLRIDPPPPAASRLREEKVCVRCTDFLPRPKGGGGGLRALARKTVGAAAGPSPATASARLLGGRLISRKQFHPHLAHQRDRAPAPTTCHPPPRRHSGPHTPPPPRATHARAKKLIHRSELPSRSAFKSASQRILMRCCRQADQSYVSPSARGHPVEKRGNW